MRRILVDRARARGRRGIQVLLHDVPARQDTILQLDEALDMLAAIDAEKAEILQMKIFGGLTNEQIGEALGMPLITVRRRYAAACAWMKDYMKS